MIFDIVLVLFKKYAVIFLSEEIRDNAYKTSLPNVYSSKYWGHGMLDDFKQNTRESWFPWSNRFGRAWVKQN